MADSAIVITSVNKAGGAGQITLLVGTSGGGEDECLIYMTLNRVEIYASKTNNRATATKIGDTTGTFVHGNLGVSETWYYWFRAIDNNSPPLVGEWYPFSPTDGVVATTSNQVPPPNSVGTPQLQDGAATAQKIANLAVGSAHIQALAVKTANIDNLQVTDAKMVTMSATKLTAGVVTATLTINAPLINGGSINGARIRIQATDGTLVEPGIIFNSTVAPNVSSVRISQTGANGEAAVYGTNLGTGPQSHGARFNSVPITGPAGGAALLGLPPASGGYAVWCENGTVGPFTGSHPGFIDKDAPDIPLGSILVDGDVIDRRGVDDTVTSVSLSRKAMDPAAIGILTRRHALDEASLHAVVDGSNVPPMKFDETVSPQQRLGSGALALRKHRETWKQSKAKRANWAGRFDGVVINGLGEGQVLICGRGGDIEKGDLACTSDLPGIGMRQPDFDLGGQRAQLVTHYTVARIREAVTFSDPDEVKLVACIYLCG
ncbi:MULTISPECIES: hypothetical protein [unclassified Chelatococcus]|uniref:hypothetical protein n=1 Tax=unclassified Chelatococcus TaxID=2638111 RepID=UPI001BCDD3BF|nr:MULTISPECIES: hypothetical protein [unclassified Chelatococcus]MBS7738383.1 hypothetical protein [Chelatococcus sp. HY11]MBX3547347.1 hypothetical protein [Chelatococcus sp.]CAH1670812.1 conserved hypothetical protein [Hyphomicrobiales bacterium]CAH1676966.1 conserved hypothetical protein [Hyphomicrobiales bacterium]